MNMEDMKKEAELQYAIREFNNVIESARASKIDLRTARNIANSMHYMAESDVIVITSAGMQCFIEDPVASQNGWHVAIGHKSFAIVTPEIIFGWLEQLLNQKKD